MYSAVCVRRDYVAKSQVGEDANGFLQPPQPLIVLVSERPLQSHYWIVNGGMARAWLDGKHHAVWPDVSTPARQEEASAVFTYASYFLGRRSCPVAAHLSVDYATPSVLRPSRTRSHIRTSRKLGECLPLLLASCSSYCCLPGTYISVAESQELVRLITFVTAVPLV